MRHINIPKQLKSFRNEKRKTVTSDDTLAFTEKPATGLHAGTARINAHELFNLFTASIIREKTSFIR
jgi:hypothetical protein